MNKTKYGEIIVDEIINAYKNSEEFENDAREYVYKAIRNKQFEICAQGGCDYALKAVEDKDAAEKLCEIVETHKQNIDKLKELFEITFGEAPKHDLVKR